MTKLGYTKNELNSFGYFWKNLNPPDSWRNIRTCNNVEPDEDIFFVETNNFPIIAGKVNTKSYCFKESFTKHD